MIDTKKMTQKGLPCYKGFRIKDRIVWKIRAIWNRITKEK